MSLTQDTRNIAVATPLGENVLVFGRMTATEQLGRLFQYDIDFYSRDHEIDPDKLLGQNVTVRLERGDGITRYFNGYLSRFAQVGPRGRRTLYQGSLRPWLWFLTRTADCRIFQEMTVPDIVKQVFRDLGFTDFSEELSGRYRTWENCVQYRETDFNFISRLLEQEGIYYYFRHEDGKHTLVLADAYSSHETVKGYEEIPYFPFDDQARRERDHIFDWFFSREVQTGTYALNDYDFKAPKKNLISISTVGRRHAAAAFEVYDYPGEYVETGDGDSYAEARVQELQARHERATAMANTRGLTTGALFKLTEYPRSDQNREYLIVSATYELQSDEYEAESQVSPAEEFVCSLEVMEARRQYRAPRVTPKPVIQGPQTAMVVGPSGEEIHTDKFGRIKLQFHWDRYGKADENSSCWVRVAQLWAGKKWGAMYLPRIGHEVIVEFLEGDPDHPIVTGRLYNGINKPPYDLPGNKTQSTLKSNSSKGGGGFNEIRFQDENGSEQIFMHAEKNLDIRVKADRFESIGNDRHLTVENDKFEHIKNERNETVDSHHQEKIGGDRNLAVAGKDAVSIDGTKSVTVGGDVQESFKADHSEEVASDYYLKASNIVLEASSNITIKVGGSYIAIESGGIKIATSGEVVVNAGSNISCEAGANFEISAGANFDCSAGASATMEGGASASVKGGGSAELKGAAVTIQGSIVKIN